MYSINHCHLFAKVQGWWSNLLHSKLFSCGMSLRMRLKAIAQPGYCDTVAVLFLMKLGGRGRFGSKNYKCCITFLPFFLSPRKLDPLLSTGCLIGKAIVYRYRSLRVSSLAAVTVRLVTNQLKSWLSYLLFFRLKVMFLRRGWILSIGRIFLRRSNLYIPYVLACGGGASSSAVSKRHDRYRLLFLPLLRKCYNFYTAPYELSSSAQTSVAGNELFYVCRCSSCKMEERYATEGRFILALFIAFSQGLIIWGRALGWSQRAARGGASLRRMIRILLPLFSVISSIFIQQCHSVTELSQNR